MRVIFCTLAYFPAVAGGAERQAQLQAEELVRRGHEVVVVCPRGPGLGNEWLNGVRVERLPRLNHRPFKTATYVASLVFFLVTRLRRFDVIHVHVANFQAHVAVLCGLLLGKPVYVKIAASGPTGDVARLGRWAMFTRYLGLKRASRVQALSAEVAVELASLGVPGPQVVRIPNGLQVDRFSPADAESRLAARARLDLPATGRIVLYTGRFATYKGIGELLTAWRLLQPAGASLVLVGTLATEDSIGGGLAGPGVIVRDWSETIQDYYQAADAFVLPSHVEGMSNSLLEAMASGLAVIATRVGAAEAMIADGETGLLIDPKNVPELQGALKTVIEEPLLASRLGASAARSSARYSIGSVVDQIEGTYASMLAQGALGLASGKAA